MRRKVIERNKRFGVDDFILNIDENVFIIGFVRRFVIYKCVIFFFMDFERLKKIVNNLERFVYIVFGGKVYLRDDGGKEFFRRVYEVFKMFEFRGKIFVMENYDMGSVRFMVVGVDVWFNNLCRFMEVSGMSGMKVGLNGVLNVSIYDGWWVEGYNGKNGWVIGEEIIEFEMEVDDLKDVESFYILFEEEVILIYYENRVKWIYMMKESIKSIVLCFSIYRMVKEYMDRFYFKVMSNYIWFIRENYSGVKEIVVWKDRVRVLWDKVEIRDVKVEGNRFEVRVYFDGFKLEDVEVEFYYGVRV